MGSVGGHSHSDGSDGGATARTDEGFEAVGEIAPSRAEAVQTVLLKVLSDPRSYPDPLGNAMTTDTPNPLLQGTLDLLILKTLSWGPRHGYAIARWVEEITDDVLQIHEGSLYPALYRMRQRRWLTVSWGESELGRRIKLYELTPEGRDQLRVLTSQWQQCVTSMTRVLQA